MGNDWDDRPLWQRQGRTGPNGPQYASRRDRNAVRRGKPVGTNSNPGGPGGKRTKITPNKARGKTTHRAGGGGGGKKDKSCCYAGQAVKAAWMRKFKLARRFARLDVKTRLGII